MDHMMETDESEDSPLSPGPSMPSLESFSSPPTSLSQRTPSISPASLAMKLSTRPSKSVLVDQGILPASRCTSALMHERQKRLMRAKTGDILRTRIARRPDRQELIERHIIVDDGRIDPSLYEAQQQLKRAKLADSLSSRLEVRPGPLELIRKNILHLPSGEAELETAVKKGQIQFKPTVEGLPSKKVELPSKYTTSEPSPPPLGSAEESSSSPALSTLPPDQTADECQHIAQPAASCALSVGPSGVRFPPKATKPPVRHRQIKFHEYKGPDCAKPDSGKNVSCESEPVSHDSQLSDETRYQLMLKQQQLVLQWQLDERNAMIENERRHHVESIADHSRSALSELAFEEWKVSDLRGELRKRGLSAVGVKAVLIERLRQRQSSRHINHESADRMTRCQTPQSQRLLLPRPSADIPMPPPLPSSFFANNATKSKSVDVPDDEARSSDCPNLVRKSSLPDPSLSKQVISSSSASPSTMVNPTVALSLDSPGPGLRSVASMPNILQSSGHVQSSPAPTVVYYCRPDVAANPDSRSKTQQVWLVNTASSPAPISQAAVVTPPDVMSSPSTTSLESGSTSVGVVPAPQCQLQLSPDSHYNVPVKPPDALLHSQAPSLAESRESAYLELIERQRRKIAALELALRESQLQSQDDALTCQRQKEQTSDVFANADSDDETKSLSDILSSLIKTEHETAMGDCVARTGQAHECEMQQINNHFHRPMDMAGFTANPITPVDEIQHDIVAHNVHGAVDDDTDISRWLDSLIGKSALNQVDLLGHLDQPCNTSSESSPDFVGLADSMI